MESVNLRSGAGKVRVGGVLLDSFESQVSRGREGILRSNDRIDNLGWIRSGGVNRRNLLRTLPPPALGRRIWSNRFGRPLCSPLDRHPPRPKRLLPTRFRRILTRDSFFIALFQGSLVWTLEADLFFFFSR